jgi:YHS domain-containing protein
MSRGESDMSDLSNLEQKIKAKLSVCEERQSLEEKHFRQQMAEAEARNTRFTALADGVMQKIIKPRMEKLKALFDNARMSETRSSRHNSCCQFEHTPRFPASALLEIGVTRDGEIKTLILQSELQILPVFFTVETRDELSTPMNEVDETKAADWVDARILHFVDTYLRIETCNHYQQENIVTDPVCGMRVNKAFAPAQMTYHGKTYYFCIAECRGRFAGNPERYLAG